MNKSLATLAMLSIAILSGCQTAMPVSKPMNAAIAARSEIGAWNNLVLSGLDEDSTLGAEAYRNDAAGGSALPETPDFVDRNWYITRGYENLRVSNGQPGEYSNSITRTVSRGPGR